jgi:hypothetical protein
VNHLTPAAKLTVKDVMKRLGLTRPHLVLDLIRGGQLRASNISSRPLGRATWRIAESDLAVFLESRVPSPPPPVMRRRRKSRPERVTEYF